MAASLGSVFTDIQKLVVIGGTVETARRASMSAWNGFVDCALFPCSSCYRKLTLFQAFFLTAHFSQEDYPYDWWVTLST